MLRVTALIVPACALLALLACSSDKQVKCTPGKVSECECAGKTKGMLLCEPDGGSATCQCPQDAGSSQSADASQAAHGGSGASADDAGQTSTQDDASAAAHDEDGGTQLHADAATAAADGGTRHDAGSTPVTYSGPCANDKECPGKELCSRSGGVSYCGAVCSHDSDCPAPSDGTATPTCTNANPLLGQTGTCALSCGALSGKCPKGMQCSALLILPGTCAF